MRRIFLLADLCLAFGLTAPRILFAESGLIFDQTQGTLTGQLNVSSNIAAAGSVTASSATLANTAGAGLTVSSSAYLAVAGGKVGIGTTSPGAKLHVGTYGTITAPVYTINNGDGLLFDFFNVGSPYTRSGNIIASAADTSEARLSFYTKALSANPTEKVTILGNGNVGIGTTNPGANLQIGDVGATNTRFTGNPATAQFYWQTTERVGIAIDSNNAWSLGAATGGAGGIRLGSGPNFSYLVGAGTSLLLNPTAGNVGIGTTVPENKLHITEASQTEFYGADIGMPVSNLVLQGTANDRVVGKGPALTFSFPANTDGTNIWSQARILASPDDATTGHAIGRLYLQVRDLYNPGAGGAWNWRTGLMIQGNGNVGIGTTGPTGKLSVYNSNGSDVDFLHYNSGTFPKVTAIGLGSDAVSYDHTSAGATLNVKGSAQIAALQSAASDAPTDMAFYTTAGGNVYERMRITTSGNVGIGTTAPGAKLQISDTPGWADYSTYQLRFLTNGYRNADLPSISADSAAIAFYPGNYGMAGAGSWARTLDIRVRGPQEAGTGMGVIRFFANDAGVSSSDVEKMRIQGNGNVGIGTASPGAKLEVNGNFKIGDNLIIGGVSNYKVYQNLASLDNYGGPAGAIVIDTNIPFTAANMFTITISGYSYGGTGPWEVTVAAYAGENNIHSARYVSVNKAGFGAPIIARNTTTGMVAVILGTTADTWNYQITVSKFTQGFHGQVESYADGWTVTPRASLADYDYQTTCADGATFTGLIQSIASGTSYITGGSVGIGTTSPGAKLEIYSATNPTMYLTDGVLGATYGGAIRGYGVTGSGGRLQLGTLDASAFYPAITIGAQGGNVGIGTASPGYTLHVNGSVAGTSAYNNLSDKRFKKDIQPITGALNKIMSLQGITFNWDKTQNPDLKIDAQNHIGFIAQDIEKILPQVVATADDKMQTKSVAYGDVVPVLGEAIKEQQPEIERLKLDNATLKSDNAALKSEVSSLKERLSQLERTLQPR